MERDAYFSVALKLGRGIVADRIGFCSESSAEELIWGGTVAEGHELANTLRKPTLKSFEAGFKLGYQHI